MIYFLSIFWSLKEIQAALFYLYLCQIKEYHLGRFLDHFKTDQGKSLIFKKITGLKILLLFFLLINLWPKFFIFLLILLYFIEFLNIIKKILENKIKKPTFTKKSSLLFFITILIIFSFLFFLIRFWEEKIALYLLIFDILSPIIFALIVFLLQPFTVVGRKIVIEKAKRRRKEQNLLVIGITGSYGKTTTKEFLSTILSEKFNVLKTKNHQNSEMGISQTILRDLKKNHDIFVCEMGAYNKGGIKLLSQIAQPKIGAVAGINEQHLSLFGSMEKLIQAEGGKELINNLEKEGTVFFNGNNKLCLDIYKETKINKKLCLIGKESDYWISDYGFKENILSCKIHSKKDNSFDDVKIKTYGKHNLSNLLLSVAIAKEIGLNWSEIKNGCLKINPEMTGIKVFESNHGFSIIDSSYSANPTGVLADLEYLKTYSGKKIIIMPCLIELGSSAKKIHKKIGQKIDEICDLAIITTSDYFEDLNSKKAILLKEPQKVINKVKTFCSKEDIVLIEGRVKKEIIEKL